LYLWLCRDYWHADCMYRHADSMACVIMSQTCRPLARPLSRW
jgi:hypothetical protein